MKSGAVFSWWSILEFHVSNNQKKRAEGDPAAQHLTWKSIENFLGEEAPVARAGPRSTDVFYRGEEARSGPKTSLVIV